MKSKITATIQNFNKFKIKTKLILAFLFLIIMITVAGSSGLIFIMTIRGHVETISDIAAPLNRISGSLANTLQEAHITVVSLLSEKNEEKIKEKKPLLKNFETTIDQNLKELSLISEKGGISLDIKGLQDLTHGFFDQVKNAMLAHEEMLKIETDKTVKLNDFNLQRQATDSAMTVFVEASQSAVGKKEDISRKISMSPEATAKEATDLMLEMFEKDIPALNGGLQLRTFLADLQNIIKSYLSEQTTDNLSQNKEKYEALANQITTRMRRVEKKLQTDEQKTSLHVLSEKYETLKKTALETEGLFDLHQKYLEAYVHIMDMQKNFSLATDSVNKALVKVLETSEQINKDVEKSTKKGVNSALLYIGLIILIGLIIGIVAAYLIIPAITSPLSKLQTTVQEVEKNSAYSIRVQSLTNDEVGLTAMAFDSLMNALQAVITEINRVMGAVAGGDFTRYVTSEQKGDLLNLKSSINESIDLLGKTLSEISDTSSTLIRKTDELSESAKTLSRNTDDQAKEIERVASSMHNIADRAKDNEQNAFQVQTISAQAIEAVDDGNDRMKLMLDSMKKIETTSAKVVEAISLINDIASRTKLLALNASIEAVRAGSAGKGFAVVADEVRTLADNSAKVASQTNQLMEQSSGEIQKGVANASQTAEVLEKINAIVENVNKLVEEISNSSVEQSTSISEINTGLTEINDAVLRNSEIAKNTADAYNELSAMSGRMYQSLKKFNFQ